MRSAQQPLTRYRNGNTAKSRGWVSAACGTTLAIEAVPIKVVGNTMKDIVEVVVEVFKEVITEVSAVAEVV